MAHMRSFWGRVRFGPLNSTRVSHGAFMIQSIARRLKVSLARTRSARPISAPVQRCELRKPTIANGEGRIEHVGVTVRFEHGRRIEVVPNLLDLRFVLGAGEAGFDLL